MIDMVVSRLVGMGLKSHPATGPPDCSGLALLEIKEREYYNKEYREGFPRGFLLNAAVDGFVFTETSAPAFHFNTYIVCFGV